MMTMAADPMDFLRVMDGLPGTAGERQGVEGGWR